MPPNPKTNSAEVAALNDLLATMNNPNIQGVAVPEEEKVIKTKPVHVPRPGPAAQPVPVAPPAPAAPPAPVQKLFFTGRIAAGKDTSAAAAGATIFGFADPIYAIAEHFFGVKVNSTEGKNLPGMREFLQVVGQWGRAVISDKYPVTTNRASFCRMIRLHAVKSQIGDRFPYVDWASFGQNPNIWLDACIARANDFIKSNPGARVAITNCRFEHEFKALQADGWQHWHVLCSAKTWTARLALSKLTPESPQVKDMSEALASQLDGSVIKQISHTKVGPMLRCIWSDTAPRPSDRLHTPDSFLNSIGTIKPS